VEGESDADVAPREDLALPQWELQANFFVDEPHDSEHPLRYSVLIEWSDADAAYHVSLPEWEGRISNPIAKTATYTEAAYEGYIALNWLTERAEREGWPLPMPLTLHR
jgi:predicted RNase H-like HicB family nuclease